jgi:hypothetical protein
VNGHQIIAIYPNRAAAENARTLLLKAGIEAQSMRLSTEDGTVEEGSAQHRSGFLSWLFGTGIAEDDRHWYEANLTEGRAALSVLVPANGNVGRIEEILSDAGAVEVDEEDDEEEQLAPLSRASLVSQPSAKTRRLIRTHLMQRPIEVRRPDGTEPE